MSTCRQCRKTWASWVDRPPLVNGLGLACRTYPARPVRRQDHHLVSDGPDDLWGVAVIVLPVCVVIGAIGGLMLVGLAWMILFGLIGLGIGFLILGAVLAQRPEERAVILPPPVPKKQAGGRGSLGPYQPDAPHASTLPGHTVTLPPPEQASQAQRPLTTVTARQHNPAKGVTRPGMSTFGETSKQPPPGSSRAAEQWPPPPRVRQHGKR